MLHPLEHVCDHQNPLADTPALASCQPPQLGRPRFAAKEVSRHRPSPKHGTLAYQLYHIWGSLEPGIIVVEIRVMCASIFPSDFVTKLPHAREILLIPAEILTDKIKDC